MMGFQQVLLVSLGATLAFAQGGPTVKISNGTLQGAKCAGANTNYFFSIPYAKPPLGDLRFTAPQSFDQSYNGTRDATQAAPACPQFNTAFAEATPQSEDCLFVDVWAPANATSTSSLPVRVWLFGGGNAAGGISNALYDGCQASTNTVQVSINYRVGPLGFLALESLGLTGNYGVQDQLLGLHWVQENIAAFGGDPKRVMLFGQSAGGTDTFIQSTLPSATSLFHSAIMQSGNGQIPTIAEARTSNEAFIRGLNCSLTDVACVRKTSLAAMNTTILALTGLSPVVDGKIIPAQPLTAGIKVPSVIGSTTNEGTLFFLAAFRESALTLNASVYDAYLNSTFGPAAAKLINQTYPVAKFAAAPATQLAPVFSALSSVVTLADFHCPARRALRAMAPGVPAWTYSFATAPSCPWYPTMPPEALILLGATHTAEIPFVFGNTDALPRPSGNCSFTPAEKALSAVMQAAWDSMAANANPGTVWPAYADATSMGVNVVGDLFLPGVVDYSMCDLWDGIAAQTGSTGNGTSTTGTGTGTATGAPATATANAGAALVSSPRFTSVLMVLASLATMLI